MGRTQRLVILMSLAALVSTVAVEPAAGQSATPSLAEVAKKEAERRQSATKSSKVYKNEDLKGGRPLTTGAAATPPPGLAEGSGGDAAASGKAEKEKTGEKAAETRAEGKAAGSVAEKALDALMKRAIEIREQISRITGDQERRQVRIDELNTAVLNSFDEVERSNLLTDREAALSEYRSSSAEAEQLSRALADLEAEIRRLSSPQPR